MSSRPLPRRERLAVLKATGEVFVNGLSSSYDDAFPASERLGALMTRDDFAKALRAVNDALIDHWPCVPCKSFGYGCCICTLGLSLYCAASQVREAERRLQLQLSRLNDQQKFKDKGIQWQLTRTWWWWSASVVEIYVDSVGIAATSSGSSCSSTRDEVQAARA